jgi:predicted kinase
MFKENETVIVSSNNSNFKLGKFLAYEKMDNCDTPLPIVQLDGDTEPVMCFGHVLPYSDEIRERLELLSPNQQYDLLTALKVWKDDHKKFIIMRGLPGSGKSTKAKKLAGNQGQVFSADDYHVMMGNGKYDFRPENVGKAHSWNQRRAYAAVEAGVPIVVIDNTNTTLREMRAYRKHMKLAMLMGYTISIEESDTEWAFNIDECEKKGTHNVPRNVLEAMYNRYFLNADVEHVLFDI